MKQAGLDFDEIKKINRTLSLGQRKRLRAMEQRPARDEKAVSVGLKALRRSFEDRRRRAERFATAGAPTRVYLDTPFMIQASNPDQLLDSNIAVFNSTASFLVDYQNEIHDEYNTTNDGLTFSFVWKNDTGQDAEINTEALLVVKGEGDCFAHPGYIPLWDDAASATSWDANLQFLEMWNQPPTSPVPDGEQRAAVFVLEADALSTWPVPNSERKIADIFQAFPLVRRGFLIVPRSGSMVFQVSLNISSLLYGGGWCTSSLADAGGKGPSGFVLCPFVELQVSTSGIMSN